MATTQRLQIETDDLIRFLDTYYRDDVAQLAQRYPNEQRSLEVSFRDLFQFDSEIADTYLTQPQQVGQYLDEALAQFDLPADIDLSNAHVRVGDLPDEHVRGPNGASRNRLIGAATGVEGQITKCTQPKPRAEVAVWECQRCGTTTNIPQAGDTFEEPHECQGCERQGPFRLNESRTEWVDHQLMRIQEPPEDSGTGQGATLDIHVQGDLINAAEPGDRVTAAGYIETGEVESGDDLDVDTTLETDSIESEKTSFDDIDIETYREQIEAIAAGEHGDPFELWIDSIKPSHYGDEHIKEAITLQLFEGWARGDRRGSSHILLMGDPGCDKSGFLEYVDDLAPRSAYASGKGTTTAGLTAGVENDDFGDSEWALSAGAMVLADQGVACIDELDKIDEDTVSSLHGALESQKVRVQKIINAELSCRTSLLAAGNPKFGRFDQYQPVGEQIDLPPTLMSRFDLMFMISDQPDKERDLEIMDHKVTASRAAAKKELGKELNDHEEESITPRIDPEVMRAYIAYAKQEIKPYMPEGSAAEQLLREEFVNIRFANEDADDAPVPITWRKQEAIERLAEASARVRLSDEVSKADVERALRLVKQSMRQVGIDPETDQFDADVVETGQSKSQRDRIKNLKGIITELEGDHAAGAPIEDVKERADAIGMSEQKVEQEIQKLKDKGDAYEAKAGHLRLV
jgi:replicative DNA helicase Mcm